MERKARQVEQRYNAILDEQRKVISTLATRPSTHSPTQLLQTPTRKRKYSEIISTPQSKDDEIIQ